MPENYSEEESVEQIFSQELVTEREALEFGQENKEEFEKWQKNLLEVVSAMKRKKDALEDVVTAMHLKRGGAVAARTLIIALGGGMQGSYGAGQMCALEQMGYAKKNLNAQDAFLGISAGSAICAFGMAGKKQTLLGTSYFYTVCLKKSFINFLRIKRAVDVSSVERALRNPPTALDTQAIRNNPAQFYVQAYNHTKKQPEFINTKDPSLDMITAIHASMAIPVVYGQLIEFNDSQYSDGAFDDPLPIVRAIELFKPTHVLILPNTPFNRIPLGEPGKWEKTLVKAIPHKGALGFVRKVLMNRHALRQELDIIAETHNVKIGVAWPPEMGLNLFSTTEKTIKNAIKISAKELFKLFGEPERELKLYEEEYGELPI